MTDNAFPSSRLEQAGAPLLAASQAAERRLRHRIAAAGPELARSASLTIDDETRTRATLLIGAAIDAAEAALRAAEPALDAAPAADLMARFRATGLLAGSGLAAAALLRAEEHRLASALVRVIGSDGEMLRPEPVVDALANEDQAVFAAEAARIDRAGDPLLPLPDLPAEDRHILFWQVAACLADAALGLQGEARAGNEDAVHRAAAGAVFRALGGVDDGDGIAPVALRLAHAIDAAGGIGDALVIGTLTVGRIPRLAALLAVRAGIGFEEARAMLTAPPRCAVLLRACGIDRPVAAAMILALAAALDTGRGEDPSGEIADILASFDALPPERALAAVRRTRLEPAYRDALARLAVRG